MRAVASIGNVFAEVDEESVDELLFLDSEEVQPVERDANVELHMHLLVEVNDWRSVVRS